MAQLYTLALTVLGAGSIIVAPVSAGDVIVKSIAACPILCPPCPYGIDTTLPCPGCCCPCYNPCKKTVCPARMQTQVVSWRNLTTGNIAGTCCTCACIQCLPVSCPSGQRMFTTTDMNGCRSCYCRSIAVPVDDIRVWSPN